MLGRLGKALAGLILTREALEAVKKVKQEGHSLPQKNRHHQRVLSPLQPMIQAIPEGTLSEVRSPDKETIQTREELIKRALEIHASQQRILSELDPESLEKLREMAMLALLNDGPLKH
jgi:hypothetical protein